MVAKLKASLNAENIISSEDAEARIITHHKRSQEKRFSVFIPPRLRTSA